MTTQEFHLAFKIKLDKEDIIGYPSFEPEEVDYWLTQGVIHFMKTRYSGSDTGKGFQQNEKRDADLRNTLRTQTDIINSMASTVTINRPWDCWYSVGEDVFIASTDRRWPTVDVLGVPTPVEKEVDPLECTVENFTSKSNDFMGEHILHANNARPLRLSFNDQITYRTDGNYYITRVLQTYISRPVPFDIRTSPNVEYAYIPEHAHSEIVSIAVALALENISDPRYGTSGRREAQIIE